MNILLAIDGSECAAAATEFLCIFPLPKESKITLVTVIESDPLAEQESIWLDPDQQNILRSVKSSLYTIAEQSIKKEAERLKKAGLATTTEIITGHPANEIIERSKELQVDLVVIGSHGQTGFKQFLLGSVSQKVLQHAHCSVLIVKKFDTGKDNTPQPTEKITVEETQQRLQILLSYDDSDSAKQAVHFCASLPLRSRDKITLLTVVPLVTIYRQDIRQHLSKIWRQKKETAREALNKIVSSTSFSTPMISTQLKEGSDVSEVIIDTIEELNDDLVILGQKGKSGVEQFFLGSVTENVAKQAKCSVLVVRR